LNLLADISQTYVDTCSLNSCISCILYSQQQIVELRVEGHCEGTICHQAANVTTVIDLHHISILEHGLVP